MAYVYDMVEAVAQQVATGATLDEVKQRVSTKLAPRYEKTFSTYDDYRPWRQGLLANIERTYADGRARVLTRSRGYFDPLPSRERAGVRVGWSSATYTAPLTLPSPQRGEGFFAPISETGH